MIRVMMQTLTAIAALMLALEPLFLAFVIASMWLNPDSLALVPLFIPFFAARVIVHQRLWTTTPLDIPLIGLLIVIPFNYVYAPYTRSLWIGSRALLGVLVVFTLADWARRRGSARELVWVTVLLGLLVGGLALGASEWTEKSLLLKPITDALPIISGFPGVQQGFNVNEIAGIMAWLVPLCAGIAIIHWRERGHPALRIAATTGFILLFSAIFLGQSRMAIFGMIAALGVLSLTIIPRGVWRWLALVNLMIFTLLEIIFFIGVFSPVETLEARDEASFTSRLNFWRSAVEIIVDYPLTGVGMNKFRLDVVREVYPVPGYENRILPHAHNEWLQIGVDLGVPGVMLFAGWHFVALWMLIQVHRRGDAHQQAMAWTLAAGFIAHGVFGLADAVALWDRGSFVFWWLMGLTVAYYAVMYYNYAPKNAPQRVSS